VARIDEAAPASNDWAGWKPEEFEISPNPSPVNCCREEREETLRNETEKKKKKKN
jgi:hypothetical protein